MDKKYKVYKVDGDDYSALSFEQKFNGMSVADAIKKAIGDKENGIYEDDENYIEISFEYKTSDKEAFFEQREHQDYDDSKHSKLYLEDEILED